MDRSPVPHLCALALAAGVAVAAVAGCAPAGSGTGSATPTLSAPVPSTGTATPGASATATPSPTAPAIPDGYPSDAQGYGQAAIAAWVAGQTTRLGQLTNSQAAAAFAGIAGHPDTHWQFASGDGAAGSSYLTFRNAPGDTLRLQVANQYLGQPHAIVDVVFTPAG
ncbi:MAG TPA: hypothetical protein VF054_14515 [Micromonosporaceae bacterium]